MAELIVVSQRGFLCLCDRLLFSKKRWFKPQTVKLLKGESFPREEIAIVKASDILTVEVYYGNDITK